MIPADDPRHGTRRGYLNGCREHCCTTALREYNRDYYETVRPYLGYQPLVDSAPVLAHLDELAAHLTPTDIANAAGMDDSAVRYLYDNRPTTVRQTTHDRVMKVSLRSTVTPLGLTRRVQALAALGWTAAHITTLAGVDKETVKALRRGGTAFTQAHVRERVLAVYADLHMRTPTPADGISQRGISRARNEAQRNGWPPPLAWDHIDDPTEQPARPKDKRTSVDLDEFMHLIRGGEHPVRAAKRVGVTVSAIEENARRHNRPDVLDTVKGARSQERNAAA